jgi:hypothetical protein
MTSEDKDKDNKIKNLDSFFSTNKEESPKSQSPTFKFDYNQIMTSFEHNQEYQFIIEHSKQLHKTEHIEIFKIIDNNGDDYTCNENGVFVALNKLKPETIKQIIQFIDFCIVNKSQLQKDLDQRDAIREIMNCQTDDNKGFNKFFLISEKN